MSCLWELCRGSLSSQPTLTPLLKWGAINAHIESWNQHDISGLGCSVRKQKCPHKSFLLPALYSTGCNELLAGSLIYIVQQQSIWWFICSGRQCSVTAQSGYRAGQQLDQESGSSPHVVAESSCGFELCFVSFALGSFFDPSTNRDRGVSVSRKYWWLDMLSGKLRMSKGLQSHQPASHLKFVAPLQPASLKTQKPAAMHDSIFPAHLPSLHVQTVWWV